MIMRLRLLGGSGERSPILAYFLAVGSDTPAVLAIDTIGSLRRALLRISSILSTPIIFPPALLASQIEATTCWANRGMVGVPMPEPVVFTCPGPKPSDAQTCKQEAIKQRSTRSPDLNRMHLEDDTLDVVTLGRGYAWLDTSTVESLFESTKFVRTVKEAQGLPVSVPEEIAFESGWIGRNRFLGVAERHGKSTYC